jgi:protoheme IX farnesyltransferase
MSLPSTALFAGREATLHASPHAISVRLAALFELTKPRLVLLVLLTVAIGYLVGSHAGIHPARIAAVLIGTALVAAGACVWNQVLERKLDGAMRRTAGRPLPAGKLTTLEATLWGSLLALLGLGMLHFGTNRLATALAAFTFVSYIGIYTPLKTITTLNTAIGAIPGALPPVIGWSAATGRLGIEAWVLFLILFLWQFPHFFAIAWLYRDEYRRAGMIMLPCLPGASGLAGRQSLAYSLLLLPVSLLPGVRGEAGLVYTAAALVLGLGYAFSAALFAWRETESRARALLLTSLAYLPLLFAAVLFDPAVSGALRSVV